MQSTHPRAPGTARVFPSPAPRHCHSWTLTACVRTKWVRMQTPATEVRGHRWSHRVRAGEEGRGGRSEGLGWGPIVSQQAREGNLGGLPGGCQPRPHWRPLLQGAWNPLDGYIVASLSSTTPGRGAVTVPTFRKRKRSPGWPGGTQSARLQSPLPLLQPPRRQLVQVPRWLPLQGDWLQGPAPGPSPPPPATSSPRGHIYCPEATCASLPPSHHLTGSSQQVEPQKPGPC